MFRPLTVFIALRYTRAKKRNHFVSFTSMTSMIGIALGVTVLITVMSVMNGFDDVISKRILGMANHVTVRALEGPVVGWQAVEEKVKASPDVKGVAPFITGQGLLTHKGFSHPVLITGILPEEEQSISVIESKMKQGSLSALSKNKFGIVMGDVLANRLGLSLGEKVTLMIPQASVTPAGIFPVMKQFTLAGTYHVGPGFGYDDQFALIHLHDAQKLFRYHGDFVSGLRIKVNEFFKAPMIANEIEKTLPDELIATNWTQEYGPLFSAIQLEKNMMFIILLLLVALATFNLVSGLVMNVTDKQSDIAILRTFGATPKFITKIFILQGAIIGLVGTLIGLIGGLIVASHTTEWVNVIQNTLHVQLIDTQVYYTDHLPSKIIFRDIVKITFAAMFMSFLSTIYPARRAAKVQPAEALRYE